MKISSFVYCVLVAFLTIQVSASAETIAGGKQVRLPETRTTIPEVGVTILRALPYEMEAYPTPAWHVEHCKELPGDCNRQKHQLMPFGDETLLQLEAINSWVNQDLPQKVTFAEAVEAAIAKRDLLIQFNWVTSSLAFASVEAPRLGLDEGGRSGIVLIPHVVLLARTTEGDVVLDTFTDELVWWHESPEHFKGIQSPTNAGEWVTAVDDRDDPLAIALERYQ